MMTLALLLILAGVILITVAVIGFAAQIVVPVLTVLAILLLLDSLYKRYKSSESKKKESEEPV